MTTGVRIRIENGVPQQPIHLMDEITWSVYQGNQDVYEPAIAKHPVPKKFERVDGGTAEKNSDGIWEVTWNYTSLSQDEIDLLISNSHQRIRGMRSMQLQSSDWTQLADAQLTEEKKAEWRTYRQALRDITLHEMWTSDPDQIVLPVQPQ